MKKLFTLSTFLLLTLVTFAQTEVGGIYYTFSGTEATVVSGTNQYTGDVIIPPSVSSGGENYSVTSIGELAFYNCSGLTSIDIPNSVTSIGSSTFYGCSGLTSVTYNVRNCTDYFNFKSRAFPSNVKEFIFGDDVESIPGCLCYGLKEITSIVIPSKVTSIGDQAFTGCEGLTSIKVQDGNTVFDSRDNCNAIIETASNTLVRGCNTTVLPKTVTGIGDYAFRGCAGLASFIIPNTVTSIGYSAFADCPNLTSVTYNVRNCKDFYNKAKPFPTNVKEFIFGDDVEYIPAYTCYNMRDMTSVTIPNSVTSIGNYAFNGCSGQTAIYSYIENPTSSTGANFDSSNYSNATLYVPFGTKDKYLATDGWKKFTNIVEMEPQPTASGTCGENLTWAYYEVDKKLVISGTGAMDDYDGNSLAPWNSYRDNIENVVFEEGVTSIGNFAICKCSGLTSVSIANSVTSIGEHAFDRCLGLISINIPNSITSIGRYAFYGCSGLTSITIPNSVTTIGKGAFADCSAITSIKVQEENTKYDSREDCNAIIETASNTLVVGCKSSVIPNNVTSIGESAFENCSGLTSIIIPNSVTSIEKDAFEDCRDLTSLSLGENVKSIGVRAFNQCTALTSISIPNSVTSIETDAFDDCTALTSIYSYIENPTNNTGANFDSSNYSNATLYVPFGTKDKYLATDGWKNFTNIVEMSIEPIEDDTVIEFDDKDYIVDNTPIDLNNTVINDMYISMDNKSDVNNPDGFYDTIDKCIVINKATSASAIATAVASDLGSSDFINNYTGIVIEVNGKGSVTINAQTIGNNKLAVKIGSADAKTYTQATKGDVTINYDVTENTYVYIYAVDVNNQQQSLSMDVTDTSGNAVKVYSVTVTPDATAIETVTEATIPAAVFGKVYSIDGKQLTTPQKGLNILKMSDGTTRKVVK